MQKRINEKPIRKVRRVEMSKPKDAGRRREVIGDIDDLIFGNEPSVPSSR